MPKLIKVVSYSGSNTSQTWNIKITYDDNEIITRFWNGCQNYWSQNFCSHSYLSNNVNYGVTEKDCGETVYLFTTGLFRNNKETTHKAPTFYIIIKSTKLLEKAMTN